MDVALTFLTAGLLSTLNPCVLPMYPGFLAYLSSRGGGAEADAGTGAAKQTLGSRRFFLGFFVLAGVLVSMLALGAVIALLSVSLSRALGVLIPVASAAIFGLGVLLLFDRNPFTRLPQVRFRALRRPALGAFVYGSMYGPVALPCNGAMVVGIFVYSVTLGDALNQLWAFGWYGLGLGAPLLAISLLSGAMQHRLTRWFARHHRPLNVFGGLLLIAVSVYVLIDNWSMLALVYG